MPDDINQHDIVLALSGRMVQPHRDGWQIKLANGGMVYGQESSTTEVDAAKMAVTLRISTPIIDRSRDIVVGSGIDVANHKMNPLVLFNHDRWMPIGLARDQGGNYTVKPSDAETISTTYFFQSSKNFQHALNCEQVFRLIESKALNGGSIGFRPKPNKTKMASNEAGNFFVIEECELIEYSHVYFPDNPEALVVAIEKGIGGRRLAEPLRAALEPLVEPLLNRRPTLTGGWTLPHHTRAKSDNPPNDQDPEPKSKPDSPVMPGGAQFLAALHTLAAEALEFCERNTLALEPEVAESFGEIVASFATISESIASAYSERYPDLPKLTKEEEPTDPPDPVAKSWRVALKGALTRWRATKSASVNAIEGVLKFLADCERHMGVWGRVQRDACKQHREALTAIAPKSPEPAASELDLAAVGAALTGLATELGSITGRGK